MDLTSMLCLMFLIVPCSKFPVDIYFCHLTFINPEVMWWKFCVAEIV